MRLRMDLTKSLAAVGLVTLMSVGSAQAYPAFTFNPASVGLGTSTTGTSFTADNIVLSNFATVAVGSGGAFTDVGYLPVAAFQFQGATLSQPSLNATTGGGFGFYFQFSASGTQNNAMPTATGTLTGGTFNFYGYNEGSTAPTFNPNGTSTTGISNPILLATGTITGGIVTLVQTTPPIPSAYPNETFNLALNESSFFQAPTPFYNALTASFTITQGNGSVTGTPSGFTINGGGGNANFIPEPSTLAVVGVAVAGLVMMGRRRVVAAA